MLADSNHLKGILSQGEKVSIREDIFQLFEATGQGVVYQSADGTIITANQATESILDLSLNELQGRKLTDSLWNLIREDGSTFADEQHPAMIALLSGKTIANVVMGIYQLNGGKTRWVQVTSIPQFLPEQVKPYQICTIFSDITEHRRAEAALHRKTRSLSMLSNCNKALVKISNEIELFQEICRICVEDGDYQMAWVGYVEHNPEKTIRPVAQYGFEEGYLESANITWDDSEPGRVPTGMAVLTQPPSIAQNFQQDPRLTPWREAAIQGGYPSCIGLPLSVGGNVIGVFTLYGREPDSFEPDEVHLLTELTKDLSNGIDALRLRAKQKHLEEALIKSEGRYKLAQQSAHIGSWEWDLQAEQLFWSDEMYILFDKKPAEFIPTHAEIMDCIVPEDKLRIVKALEDTLNTGIPLELEFRILDSAGQIKWLNTKGGVINSATGHPELAAGTVQDITRRREAEEVLKRASQKYKLISENVEDVIWVLDGATKKFIYVSPSVQKLRGYSPEEVMQQSMVDVLSPQSYEKTLTIMDKAVTDFLQGKFLTSSPVELDQIRKNGSIVSTEVTSTLVYDAEGKVQVIGISRDITKRKQMERSLQRRLMELETVYQLSMRLRGGDTVEELLQILMDETLKTINTQDGGIFLLKPSSNKLELSVARGWLDQMVGLTVNSDEGISGQVFTTNQSHITLDIQGDLLLTRKVKDLVPVQQCGGFFPIQSSEGIIGVLDVFVPQPRVISENDQRLLTIISQIAGNAILRLRLHEQLKLSNIDLQKEINRRSAVWKLLGTEKELLSATLMSIAEGVIITNKEGLILLFNRAAESLTGFKEHDVTGYPLYSVFQLIDPNTQQVISDSIHALYEMSRMQENDPSYKAPLLITKSGERILVSGSISLLKSHSGEIMGHVLAFQNITEKHKAEVQTALSQKMEAIGQLAAGIAHEINTPIQYIGDNLKFLQKTVSRLTQVLEAYQEVTLERDRSLLQEGIDHIEAIKKQNKIQHYLDESPKAVQDALEGVERVRKIVLAMREFSHPSEKGKRFSDINHGIETTVVISHNEWKYYAELDTDLDPEMPLVNCQIDEINQVILNMIVNAAQSIQEKIAAKSDQKGKISISTQTGEDKIVIKIQDTGQGIPEEIQQRIFDPFFTTKGVGKGTGQGLSLAHNIIAKKHHGNIKVDSIVGEGTTFIIELPIDSSEQEAG